MNRRIVIEHVFINDFEEAVELHETQNGKGLVGVRLVSKVTREHERCEMVSHRAQAFGEPWNKLMRECIDLRLRLNCGHLWNMVY